MTADKSTDRENTDRESFASLAEEAFDKFDFELDDVTGQLELVSRAGFGEQEEDDDATDDDSDTEESDDDDDTANEQVDDSNDEDAADVDGDVDEGDLDTSDSDADKDLVGSSTVNQRILQLSNQVSALTDLVKQLATGQKKATDKVTLPDNDTLIEMFQTDPQKAVDLLKRVAKQEVEEENATSENDPMEVRRAQLRELVSQVGAPAVKKVSEVMTKVLQQYPSLVLRDAYNMALQIQAVAQGKTSSGKKEAAGKQKRSKPSRKELRERQRRLRTEKGIAGNRKPLHARTPKEAIAQALDEMLLG